MPRFFFHVQDGHTETDLEGTELPDVAAARHEAIQRAGRILADDSYRLAVGEDWEMIVTGDHGLIYFRIDFHVSEAPVTTQATSS